MSGYSEVQSEAFLNGYLVSALWSSTDDDGEPLDALYQIDDFAEAAKRELRKDVTDFVSANAEDLAQLDPGAAGHDFWLSRNGHGTGFWDRGLGDLGDRLHAAAKVYGGVYVVVGDDGRLYV